jgi:hypothetical protein
VEAEGPPGRGRLWKAAQFGYGDVPKAHDDRPTGHGLLDQLREVSLRVLDIDPVHGLIIDQRPGQDKAQTGSEDVRVERRVLDRRPEALLHERTVHSYGALA